MRLRRSSGGLVAIYVVNGARGNVGRRLSQTTQAPGCSSITTSGRRTITQPGFACEVLTGDYLECELAALVDNSGGAPVVPTHRRTSDGTRDADYDFRHGETTDPMALVIAPSATCARAAVSIGTARRDSYRRASAQLAVANFRRHPA